MSGDGEAIGLGGFVMTIDLVLYLLAFVAFALAAAGITTRVNLVALGLALLTLSLLV